MRAGLVPLAALLLLSCGTAPPPAPPSSFKPPRAEVPDSLRRCALAPPPPAVPGLVRTPEQTDAYAWAEARGRWRTADLLRECAGKLGRLNDWIRAQP